MCLSPENSKYRSNNKVPVSIIFHSDTYLHITIITAANSGLFQFTYFNEFKHSIMCKSRISERQTLYRSRGIHNVETHFDMFQFHFNRCIYIPRNNLFIKTIGLSITYCNLHHPHLIIDSISSRKLAKIISKMVLLAGDDP